MKSDDPTIAASGRNTQANAGATSKSASRKTPSGAVRPAAGRKGTRRIARSEAGGASSGFIGSPWVAPSPVGVGSALAQFYSVAAPVLAGFSIAFIGLVVTSRGAFVAADFVLWLATVAAGALIFGMQLGMWAHSHWVEPSVYLGWFPLARRGGAPTGLVRDEQANDVARWDWYRIRAGRFYRLGLVAFLAAVAAAVLPPTAPVVIPAIPLVEWLPTATAVIWLALEVIWVVGKPAIVVERLFVPRLVVGQKPIAGYPDDMFVS